MQDSKMIPFLNLSYNYIFFLQNFTDSNDSNILK